MDDTQISPLTLICVGSSFAFSGLFYHLYQQKKLEIQRIKETPKFQPDEDLVKTVKASPRKRLQYVAIEGVVQPDGEPLASQYVPRCFGVVQKVVVREHWKFWNSKTKIWTPREMNTKETNNVVPFSLVYPGALFSKVSVKVQSPLEAAGPFMEQVYRRMRHAKEDLVNILVQEMSGEKPVAQEETEELLRVGATLTGFGEVVLEQGHVLRLQPPQDGRQYLLVPTDYRGFLQMHQNTATMWKVLTALFGLAGATLLAWALYRVYRRQDNNRPRN
ncbi:hypothetical protein MATL_G00241270 [Megalops atlanticus]|uniref:RING-type E3 ubiquitin transferase n=1 Tax=Megalops atlanticus TaxID=7932 RepID=A0A9D3T1N5_MEGAT|nr:hypothetical protein MATL_G00241270 [Megalops atlanticus]